jgi:hypothetical protein
VEVNKYDFDVTYSKYFHAVDNSNSIRMYLPTLYDSCQVKDWRVKELIYIFSMVEANAYQATRYFAKGMDNLAHADFRRALAEQMLSKYAKASKSGTHVGLDKQTHNTFSYKKNPILNSKGNPIKGERCLVCHTTARRYCECTPLAGLHSDCQFTHFCQMTGYVPVAPVRHVSPVCERKDVSESSGDAAAAAAADTMDEEEAVADEDGAALSPYCGCGRAGCPACLR